MSAIDQILGKSPSTSTQTLDTLNPDQKKLFESLSNQVSGKDAFGTTNLQELSLTALEDRAKSLATGQGQTQAADVLSKIMGLSDSQNSNDTFNKSVQDPLLKAFERDILPRISRNYASSGFGGSDQRKAGDTATRNLLDTLVQKKAEFTNSNLDRALLAAQASPGSTNELLNIVTQAGGIQNIPEDKRMQVILQLLGIQTQENVVTVDPGTSGLLAPLAQGFGMAGGEALGKKIGTKIF